MSFNSKSNLNVFLKKLSNEVLCRQLEEKKKNEITNVTTWKGGRQRVVNVKQRDGRSLDVAQSHHRNKILCECECMHVCVSYLNILEA